MRRIDEGVQQADRNALHAFVPQHRHQRANGSGIKWQQHVAFVIEPFRHRQAQMPRHQWFRQHDVEVILVVAALVAHRDHVAQSLGGEQRDARALAFNDRVGSKRSAVDDDSDLGGSDARGLQDFVHAHHDAQLGCRRCGQDLDGGPRAVMLECKVGEGAADIDGKSSGRHQVLRLVERVRQ